MGLQKIPIINQVVKKKKMKNCVAIFLRMSWFKIDIVEERLIYCPSLLFLTDIPPILPQISADHALHISNTWGNITIDPVIRFFPVVW